MKEFKREHIFLGAILALSVIALSTAVALVLQTSVIQSNRDLAREANQTANSLQFQNEIAREKICGETTNKIDNCQALFERLSSSLSNAQRFRLACQTAGFLKGPTAENLLRENPQCRTVLKEKHP